MMFFSLLLLLSVKGTVMAHDSNHANKHMHKTSHVDLIKRFEDPKRDLEQRPQEVLKLLGPLKDLTVIDIGVGSGYFAQHFLKAGARVTGADVDEKFLAHVSERFKAEPKFSSRQIAFDDPKMEASSFDLAFMSNTYHHVENRVAYFKKVLAGLSGKGRVAVFDFRPHTDPALASGPPQGMRVEPATVVAELKAAGFRELKVQQAQFPQHYLVVGSK